MNKLTVSTLATSSLLLAVGTSIAAPQADLGLDPNRLLFIFYAPSGDSGNFPVHAGNLHNPIILPCDLTSFGGDVDIHYTGPGPDVYPRLTATMTANGKPIFVGGDPQRPFAYGGMNLITANTVQPGVGYTPINVARPWLFQPTDLPPDTVVVMHIEIAPYLTDPISGTLIADPNPADNSYDIFLRRVCHCP
jgi:hypothetical protein